MNRYILKPASLKLFITEWPIDNKLVPTSCIKIDVVAQRCSTDELSSVIY